MKKRISLLTSIAIVVSACAFAVYAAPQATDDTTTVKVRDAAGNTLAVVTLAKGSKVIPLKPFVESPADFGPTKYNVYGAGIRIVSAAGDELFALDTAGRNASIEYEAAAKSEK